MRRAKRRTAREEMARKAWLTAAAKWDGTAHVFNAEEAGYIAGLDKLPCEVPEEYAATAADWLVGYDAGRHRSLEADEKLASVGLQ